MTSLPTPPAFSASLGRQLLESLSEGVSLSGEDGIIVYTNPALDQMLGYESGELAGKPAGVHNDYPPEENQRLAISVVAALNATGSWRGEMRKRRKDGSTFVTDTRISAVEIDGRPLWLSIQEDVSEQRKAVQALRESEGRLELATRASRLGVWDWDLVRDVMVHNDLAIEIYGFAAGHSISLEEVRATTHPADRPFTLAQSKRALDPAVRERRPYEYRLVRPDGEVRWVRAHGEVIFDETGEEARAVRYVGTIEDITDDRLSSERLQLLAEEVDHRANNLMAVVQAAVELTRADTLEDYRRLVNGRIRALANAHRLLSKSRWQGADFNALVEEELRPYRLGDTARVRIEGPRVELAPPAAQALSMVIHELATNAAKYGALRSGGEVSIGWSLSSTRELMIEWREVGAEPVDAPSRRGFGLRMIEQSIVGQLGGTVRIDHAPQGVACYIAVPASSLV